METKIPNTEYTIEVESEEDNSIVYISISHPDPLAPKDGDLMDLSIEVIDGKAKVVESHDHDGNRASYLENIITSFWDNLNEDLTKLTSSQKAFKLDVIQQVVKAAIESR